MRVLLAEGSVRMAMTARSGDLVALYLGEIGRYPLLTPAEEVALGEAISAGREAAIALAADLVPADQGDPLRALAAVGDEARAEFIDANLRLVVAVARAYQHHGVALLDLIQEGNVGLMRAVDRWDWRRGCKFSTYAVWWIRNAIMKALDTSSRAVRLSTHAAERARLLRRMADQLTAFSGASVSTAALARAAGVPEAEVRLLLEISRQPASLSAPVGEDGSLGELGDLVADTSSLSPEEEAEIQSVTSEVLLLLHHLSDRETSVIRARFGLDGSPRSLAEVAGQLGVSRERARQIENKALGKLRRAARSSGLESLLSA